MNLRNRHLFVLDLLAGFATPIIALALRLENFQSVPDYAGVLLLYIPTASLVRFIIFRRYGLYSRFWRYASIDELQQIANAVALATLALGGLFLFIVPPLDLVSTDLPRSIPFLDGMLILLTAGGSRYSVRLFERMRQRRRNRSANNARVVILGAGDAGAMIVKEMQANPQLGFEPIVFLDDDPQKRGAWIHGVPIVGDRSKIPDVVKSYHIQQAIIAMPTAPGKTIRELTRLCQEANLPVKTVPGMFELLDGSVAVSQLRPVDIADLLRREPVATDLTQITELLHGKRVLVTGAGGSIGSELCRQIARCGPAELVLLGHGENSIFEIYNELKRLEIRDWKLEIGSNLQPPTSTLHPTISDLRDPERLNTIFSRFHPQIVFHAAAHKHVPLMEENVEDAVTNNVLGTRNLLECAAAGGVEHFVLVSTDKAVNPTSIMGATKRVAELLVQQAAAQSGRCFVAVRFGNVLGSRGSVVPFFRWQIAQGGPVTVTDPEVRRYFMTIPEAVQLVLQAATLGKGGEIFVLDMGEPIKIVDLARDLIRLSGLEEGRDIDIVFTGMRPGEKLFEEMFLSEENYQHTVHEKIFVARNGKQVSSCKPQVPGSNLPPTSNFSERSGDPAFFAGQLPTSNPPPATGNLPPATGDPPPATGNLPPATGNLPPATGDLRPATCDLQPAIASLLSAAQAGNPAEIRRVLQSIVPEYHYAESAGEPATQGIAPTALAI
ncbi:MAG: polysaccharide biosynthesis protein [Chloroflexi bacterium]|nr:polysaccharide biosynthesis protein [Chloroflexota bacterium]